MKALLAVLFLAIGLTFTACATGPKSVQPVHGPVTIVDESTAAKAYRLAHWSIDEAYTTLDVLNVTISAKVKDKSWSKVKAQEYLDLSKKRRLDVDKVLNILKAGNIGEAKAKAEAITAEVQALK